MYKTLTFAEREIKDVIVICCCGCARSHSEQCLDDYLAPGGDSLPNDHVYLVT